MITNWIEQQQLIKNFNAEFKYTRYYVGNKPKATKINTVVVADKPTYIYTDQSLDLRFKELDDRYEIMFGQGILFPSNKVGFAWYNDEHSIFFFERPFQNKVLKVLKSLLPDADIKYNRNDIEINGTKNGASLRTGWDLLEDEEYVINDGKDVLINETSKPFSGMIYILRWDNLDELNNVFHGNLHHEERLKNKNPLSTLAQFLEPIGITKEKFIELLETE